MILHCDSPQYDHNMRLVKITAPTEATLKQKQVLWIQHKRWEAQVLPCCGKSKWGFPWKTQVALLVASPTIPFTTSRLGWMTSQYVCGFVCPHQRPFFCTFSSVVAWKQRCSKFSGAPACFNAMHNRSELSVSFRRFSTRSARTTAAVCSVSPSSLNFFSFVRGTRLGFKNVFMLDWQKNYISLSVSWRFGALERNSSYLYTLKVFKSEKKKEMFEKNETILLSNTLFTNTAECVWLPPGCLHILMCKWLMFKWLGIFFLTTDPVGHIQPSVTWSLSV